MDGSFRRKESFTVVQNSIVRDKELPLKAKGLYLIIQSYITMPDRIWRRSDFEALCTEGQKAFDSAWTMLKEAGYLKVHIKSTGTTFEVEYELLDEKEEGPHTLYYNSAGELTKTNLSRTPQNGSNGNGSNGNGTNGDGSNGNGGNNNQKLDINTNNKNSINHSMNSEPENDAICTGGVIGDGEGHENDFEKLYSPATLGKVRSREPGSVADLSFALKSLRVRKETLKLRNKEYEPQQVLSILLRLSETELVSLYEKVVNAALRAGAKRNIPAYMMACLAGETDRISEGYDCGRRARTRTDYNAIAMHELLSKIVD